jgi:hypothetical protein
MELHEEILEMLAPLFDDVSVDVLADAPAPLDLNVRADVIRRVEELFRKASTDAIELFIEDFRQTLHMHDIGALLRERRRTLKKTQDDVEKDTDIARSILSRYENGRRIPRSQKNIDKLCGSLWPAAVTRS